MDRCVTCGAALAPSAAWCGQCFTPTGGPDAAGPGTGGIAGTSSPITPSRAFAPAPSAQRRLPPTPVRRTRWAKTPTTFGPAGRIVATLLLLVPLAVMVVGGVADPFVWGGAGAYLVIVVPWALRDIWKAGVVPAR